MPDLDDVVQVADQTLHPMVRERVPEASRLEALRKEMTWALTTAMTDLEFAEGFAAAQPQSGQPPEAFLNRWVTIADDLSALVGPRYRSRDPAKPFVSVEASTRPITAEDLPALRSVLGGEFSAFDPLYVRCWNAEPPGAWPGTRPDMRNVVGHIADLRQRPLPSSLTARTATDLVFYDRYAAIHQTHVEREPEHAVHSRVETREDLTELIDDGTLFEVFVDDQWAGIVGAYADTRAGLTGFTVEELILDHAVRGRGYGSALSTVLARELPADGDTWLLGTIHADNVTAYRSALAAGRADVGGEVLVTL